MVTDPTPVERCRRGHEMTVANTRWHPAADGRKHRQCRACERIATQARRRANPEKVSVRNRDYWARNGEAANARRREKLAALEADSRAARSLRVAVERWQNWINHRFNVGPLAVAYCAVGLSRVEQGLVDAACAFDREMGKEGRDE